MPRMRLRTLLDRVGHRARLQAVVLVLVASGSLALQADGNSVRPLAVQPGQVALALNLTPANGIITAGEPVIAHIEVTNVTDHEVEVVRGHIRRPALILEI